MTLYRQYRPIQFKDLIGQDTPRTILQRAIRKQRIAHAYLFSGPRGTGKTSAARIFARALCCLTPLVDEKNETLEPCGTCENCQLILQNQATDLIEIDAASNRGIEDIRLLREQAQYPPAQLTYRIYIIDECHMLTGDAFNALLKTLEEPPSHCIFILATTELHKVPLTVRSRCQLIRFERGSVAAITAKLDHIVADNTWNVEAGVTKLIAEYADGGFRDAETTLEQLTTRHASLDVATVTTTLGTVSSSTCAALLDACLQHDETLVKTLLEKNFSDQTLRFGWILTELINQLRTLGITTPTHTFALQQFLEASLLQKNTPVQSLPLEIACYSIAQHDAETQKAKPIFHSIQPAPVKTRESSSIKFESGNNTSMDVVKVTPKPVEVPQSVPVVELRQAQTHDIRKAWKEAIEDVIPVSLPLAQMLKGTLFHMTEGNIITIYVRYKFHLEKISERKNRELMEDCLKAHTGETWRIKFELNGAIPKQEPKKHLNSGSLDANAVNDVFSAAE